MEIRVKIPTNASGIVVLPGAKQDGVLESGVPAEQVSGIHSIQNSENGVRIALGSGSYQFTYQP